MPRVRVLSARPIAWAKNNNIVNVRFEFTLGWFSTFYVFDNYIFYLKTDHKKSWKDLKKKISNKNVPTHFDLKKTKQYRSIGHKEDRMHIVIL